MCCLDDIIEAHSSNPTKREIEGVCTHCGDKTTLILTPSMTRYEDPAMNAPFYLCKPCSEEYIDMMTDRWNEYWSGVL